MFLSIIIPALNEEESITHTIEEVQQAVLSCDVIDRFEIIVVDDHSSDSTYQKVKGFNRENIKCLRLSRQSGSYTALRAGLAHCKGDAAVVISADLQEDPYIISQMVKQLKEGKKVVWGLRFSRKNEPLSIRLPAILFYSLLNLLKENTQSSIDHTRADFFLIDRQVIDLINACEENATSLPGLVDWAGFDQGYVEYDRKERSIGKSRWNFKGRITFAKDWIIAFSAVPLRMITWVGVAVAILGFFYALVVIYLSFQGNVVPGWSSLMVVILFLGGINMTMLGVIGEYLWRTLQQVRRRPLYIIEKRTDEEC